MRNLVCLVSVLSSAPAAAGTADAALADAYFRLICMGAVQARLDTSPGAKDRTAMLTDQAWVVVEVSDLKPERIQALHTAATGLAAGFEAFHQCLTADPPG